MANIIKAAGLAGVLAVALATAAPASSTTQPDSTPNQGQAMETRLDASTSAVTYWVRETDGWHVVTTIDTVTGQESDKEQHAVVRFSSVLLPGQSQLISVPFATGERQQILRIRCLGDRIEVAQVPGSSV